MGEFFVNYHKQSGENFKVLGVKGSKEAGPRLDEAVRKGKTA
jgi:hypothetical protein